jgi:iron-sulfur cluster assembly accessory protein
MATPAVTDAPITVTDAASAKIRQLAAKGGHPEALLRLRVVAGGCSGFSYELGFSDATDPNDVIVHGTQGVRVAIDPKSVPIVAGSTLDFDPALMGGGLKVRNPQAVHECACGDSFSI